MKIFVEGYCYSPEFISNFTLLSCGNSGRLKTVGYFYDNKSADCIFCLPKAILGKEQKILDRYAILGNQPLQIEDLKEDCDRDFVYNLSIWLYKALVRYNSENPNNSNISPNLISSSLNLDGSNSTLFDILIEIVDFYEKNKDFLIFRRSTSESNRRINWRKTIHNKLPYIKGNRIVYIDCISNHKEIDNEEDLLMLFFSIVNYIAEKYGLTGKPKTQIKMIDVKSFDIYLKGKGLTVLQGIRNNYFTDTLVKMWNLCYTFFSKAGSAIGKKDYREFITCNTFDRIFESMVEDLIGDKEIHAGLKDQRDNKHIDHLFKFESLLSQKEEIYYVGDSKYHSRYSDLGDEDIYKQYTYIKNLHRELIADGKIKDNLQYRDELTEGYNIIPNFFISAYINSGDLNHSNPNLEFYKAVYPTWHFENRLFDRDSLMALHFSANFQYLLHLYADNNWIDKSVFKRDLQKKIRDKFVIHLNNGYEFFIIKLQKEDENDFVTQNFYLLSGKIFRVPDLGLILALKKTDSDSEKGKVINQENRKIIDLFAENGIQLEPWCLK